MQSLFFKSQLLLIQGLLLVLLACAPARASGQPPANAVPPPSPVPSPAAMPVAAPTELGPATGATAAARTRSSLIVAGAAGIPHRDVHQEVQDALTTLGPGLAYSRLLKLRPGPAGDQSGMALECDLCESWRMTSDFSYEFRLRSDVRWHNIPPVYGRPLVAQDLVFSYNRLRTPGWPNAALLRPIGSVAALDPRTLRVRQAFADSDGLLALADGHSKVVAPEVLELYGDLKDSPVVGTGPWVWESTTEGQGTVLVRNPTYFEPGRPFLDRLEVRTIRGSRGAASESLARVAAYQAGQVDVLSPDPQEWQMLQRSGLPVNSVISHQGGPGLLMALNVQSPVLADLAVRQAIFKAIDPWDQVDQLWTGQGHVGVGLPALQPDWLLSREELRARYFADPAQARKLLATSGIQLPLDLELAVGDFGPAYLASAEGLAGDLRAVGLNLSIRRLTPAQFQDRVLGPHREYQIALGTLPPVTTINGFLAPALHSRGRWNISGHQDSRLDALIVSQAAELDPARRRQQVLEVQRHVLDQAYLFSPVTGATRWAFRPDLRNFQPTPALSEYLFWSRVWREP